MSEALLLVGLFVGLLLVFCVSFSLSPSLIKIIDDVIKYILNKKQKQLPLTLLEHNVMKTNRGNNCYTCV